MKFNHLDYIINQIKNGALCPNCRGKLEESDIDLGEIFMNEVEFLVCCPHCGAELSIVAHLAQIVRVPGKIRPKNFFAEKSRISADSVQNISKIVHNFRGQDIRELFS